MQRSPPPATDLCKPQVQLVSDCSESDAITAWTFKDGQCAKVEYEGCGLEWNYFNSDAQCQDGN
jgi:hypothetical protein